MGSTQSSELSQKTDITNEQTNACYSVGFPVELLYKIIVFLEWEVFAHVFPIVCKQFKDIFKDFTRRNFNIAEQFFFHEGPTCPLRISHSPMGGSQSQRRQYFYPDIVYSPGDILQPEGWKVHIFLNADSKDAAVGTIRSIVLEAKREELTSEASKFLSNLLRSCFARNLKLNAFRLDDDLAELLQKRNFDSIYLKNPSFFTKKLKLYTKRLHMTLDPHFQQLEYAPCNRLLMIFGYLEELSIYFSGKYSTNVSISLVSFSNLKKM